MTPTSAGPICPISLANMAGICRIREPTPRVMTAIAFAQIIFLLTRIFCQAWCHQPYRSGVLCDILSTSLQIGSCITSLIVSQKGSAWTRRQSNPDGSLSNCGSGASNQHDVGSLAGSDGSSVTYSRWVQETQSVAEDANPYLDPSFILNDADGVLLRDLVVKAAHSGYGMPPMERWLSVDDEPAPIVQA
ncbi:hypothetical protein F5884DRAFT_491702 [Xylogone sp. PMI_703]|nr:hypothetical protein F5884DRAFT_491702 [Xylogone sp. PMI_703]